MKTEEAYQAFKAKATSMLVRWELPAPAAVNRDPLRPKPSYGMTLRSVVSASNLLSLLFYTKPLQRLRDLSLYYTQSLCLVY